ncbi:MAG TPA: FAD-binding oxidoreductase [Actinomycetota bacterium]|nr:FAD-binding oxidoreductase [Actinomycetota bacterium]
MDPLASLAARLPEGAVSTHPGEIATRAHDLWPLALLRERRGEALPRPMAVVFPRSTEDVAAALAWADETRTAVVPRGGGSGVCGGAQAPWRSVVLDLSQMNRVRSVDEESLAVEVEAGIRGDRLEAALGERGLTLGHYPQSLAISSVGGWLASRSAGQASAGYGVIEDLVLGLVAVLPGGEVVRLRPTPRSAAGPDLRRLFVGSEGTLGVITEVTLSASRAPAGLRWVAAGPPSFEDGMALVRRISQGHVRPLVLRLYDEADAAFTFGATGHEGGPVLIAAVAEEADGAARLRQAAREAGAAELPEGYGVHWWDHRFEAVDLYRRIMGEERMLGEGTLVETVEVAGLWRGLPALYGSIREALASHAETVGCHLSHPYRSGASLYFTELIRAPDDERAEEAYLASWRDAARACHAAGGTITHHHGVGVLKAPFMEEELGAGGLAALRAVKRSLDPAGVLNPGKLLPAER